LVELSGYRGEISGQTQGQERELVEAEVLIGAMSGRFLLLILVKQFNDEN